jgi:AcrR family transcriptional regulator
MRSAGPIRADSAATRLRIIRAAEALFSEKGVDGVSLQEIGRAAGQRNRSAVRYHFEDRLGLLGAILARHAKSIAEERSRLIDAIERDHTQQDLLRVSEAWVLPVARAAEDPDGGMDFVRISAELIGHASYSGFYFSRVDDLVASRRLAALIAGAGPEVPPEYRRPRTIAFAGFLFHSIADWSNASAKLGEATRRREWRALKRYLVDATAAQWAIQPWCSLGDPAAPGRSIEIWLEGTTGEPRSGV